MKPKGADRVGKVTIEVRREVPGHVANRLRAALWREAIHLVNEGVASVSDVDTAHLVGSASGTPTASTAGGTTSATRGSTVPRRPAWSTAWPPGRTRTSTPSWPAATPD